MAKSKLQGHWVEYSSEAEIQVELTDIIDDIFEFIDKNKDVDDIEERLAEVDIIRQLNKGI